MFPNPNYVMPVRIRTQARDLEVNLWPREGQCGQSRCGEVQLVVEIIEPQLGVTNYYGLVTARSDGRIEVRQDPVHGHSFEPLQLGLIATWLARYERELVAAARQLTIEAKIRTDRGRAPKTGPTPRRARARVPELLEV
jgi:hypothetical protein